MKKRNVVKIAPSLLSANYSDLIGEIKHVEKAGADLIHWDIMDGCYVADKTFTADDIKKARPVTKIEFDVHLMVCNPEKRVSEFVEAGADYISFHIETCQKPEQCLKDIREKKVKAGLAVNANVPVETVFPYLKQVDFILIMSVMAGKAGQGFMPEAVEKIKALKKEIDKKKLNIEIEVDGGINIETAKPCKAAGANMLVSGSALFKAENMKKAIEVIRRK